MIIAVEIRRSRIRPHVSFGKAVASALTIGSGGSGGTEGPIVQIGSAFGSTIGQALRLSEENTRLLLASGAAAGVAAVFNAPIAGVFFALEVILRRFSTRNFSVVVLASVVGTTTAVAFRGNAPALIVHAYGMEHASEILLYAVLGVICAVVGVAFTRALYAVEGMVRQQRRIPSLLLPAAGGLLVGLIGLWDHGALGIGDEATDMALLGESTARAMLLLAALKLATTVVTLGSGGSSGVFRPSLMMGALVGGAYGIGVNALWPGATVASGTYATVGMAATFSGAARAPITSILIIFETTRDYHLMLPLMTAMVTATAVASVIDHLNIYTRRLHMLRIHIDEETEASNVMQTVRVADTMGPITINFAADTPLSEVTRAFSGDPNAAALVLDAEGHVRGVVTNTDVNEAIISGDTEPTAIDVGTTDVRTIFGDNSLHDTLSALAGQSFTALPVVDRDRPRIPRGILRRADITNAYASAIEDKDASRRRDRLSNAVDENAVDEDVRYLDYRVHRGSPADGQTLRDLPLTTDAIVVAVRREGHTLIPRGDTRLVEGDRVTVIATRLVVDSVRALFDA